MQKRRMSGTSCDRWEMDGSMIKRRLSYENPRMEGMGENARSRMQNKAAISAEKFSSGNFAERVEKIYEQQIRKYRYENAA